MHFTGRILCTAHFRRFACLIFIDQRLWDSQHFKSGITLLPAVPMVYTLVSVLNLVSNKPFHISLTLIANLRGYSISEGLRTHQSNLNSCRPRMQQVPCPLRHGVILLPT